MEPPRDSSGQFSTSTELQRVIMERPRNNYGQFSTATELLWECDDCSYSTKNRKTAFSHGDRHRHTVHRKERQIISSQPSTSHSNAIQQEIVSQDMDQNDEPDDLSSSFPPDPGSDSITAEPEDGNPEEDVQNSKWYPFDNYLHYILCFLFHGSHNHKITQQVLKVLILAFKEYSDEVPTLSSVVDFTHEYWEEKILRKVPFKQTEFSFLSPWGILAMRAGNPLWTNFDCLPENPQMDDENGSSRTGQSSAMKWWTTFPANSVRINETERIVYIGDTFLDEQSIYLRIDRFFQSEGVVFVKVHRYCDEDDIIPKIGSPPSHVLKLAPVVKDGKHVSDIVKLEKLRDCESIREQNFVAELSEVKWTQTGNGVFQIENISHSEFFHNPNVEQTILDPGHKEVTAVNVHIDDTSMNPQSKVWKAATCISLQLAGAPTGSGGFKHGDGGTILLSVAPAKVMSADEILDCMRPDFDKMQDGFSAFDVKSRKLENIQAGVAVVEADLEATRELNPFKGASGNSFCGRCNMTVSTTLEEEHNLIPRTRDQLDRQIEEINNCRTVNAKTALCKLYGIVPERYPPICDMFVNFSIFGDFACDTLHLVLLGINKKWLVAVKSSASEEQLKRAAAVVDSVMSPLLYKNKPSSTVVLSPASQIGRSFKGVLQVFYYALHIAGFEQYVSRCGFNVGELNKYLFSESDPLWTIVEQQKLRLAIERTLTALDRYFPEVRSPKSHYVKHHMMQDLEKHGSPSSYSCQGGERKMKVEKIAQAHSNKANTNRDITKKLLSVEIFRHIVTNGVLDDQGRTCSEAVKTFARNPVCQDYLGLKSTHKGVAIKLGDYENKSLLMSKPPPNHVAAGCPNLESSTWRRIVIDGEKIVRGGGVRFKEREVEIVGIVEQIYKNFKGTYVIISTLDRILCEDQFLSYTEQNVYSKSSNCVVVNNIRNLSVQVLLHACKLENEICCDFFHEYGKLKYNCVGEAGSVFFHNSCALAKNN